MEEVSKNIEQVGKKIKENDPRMIDTVAATMRSKTNEMLRSIPSGVEDATIENWKKFKRLDCGLFEQFWAKANPD